MSLRATVGAVSGAPNDPGLGNAGNKSPLQSLHSASMYVISRWPHLPSQTHLNMFRKRFYITVLLRQFRQLQDNLGTYISAYLEYFHPSLPLLHQTSVNARSPPLLLNIIAAIGSLYTASTLSDRDAASCVELSQSLWAAGHDEIHRLVSIGSHFEFLCHLTNYGHSYFPIGKKRLAEYPKAMGDASLAIARYLWCLHG